LNVCARFVLCVLAFLQMRLSGTADSNKQGSGKPYVIHSMRYNQ